MGRAMTEVARTLARSAAAASAGLEGWQPGAERPARTLGEDAGNYAIGLAEHELTALWLLGRIPDGVLPWPLLRPGRAGRGAGPDVREAVVQLSSGVPLAGDIEVHLRASDFVRHGHATDPAYDGLILHVVWEDDRGTEAGTPTELPGGDMVLTVEVGPALRHSAARLRELVRRGPSGAEPCGGWAATTDPALVRDTVRAEGRRRLAERAWGAGRLAELNGWAGAWEELLIRALRASAGRRRERDEDQQAMATRISAALGDEPLVTLDRLARTRRTAPLIEVLRCPGGPGRQRAIEIGWNAVLPLIAAAAAGYGDRELAANVAILVDHWPAPRPYGRTDALARLIEPPAEPVPHRSARLGRGALFAQGLLHVQDLWCERGGCGVCPLSG